MERGIEQVNESDRQSLGLGWESVSEREKEERDREIGEKTLEAADGVTRDDAVAVEALDEETREVFLGLMEDYRTRGVRARDAFLYDQQVFEKELNARLTKVDELEAMSSIEGSGVRKDYTDYLGHRITVYVLEGYPFEMLTSWIDGRAADPGERGEELARERFNHPELWMKSREEVIKEAGDNYGQKGLYNDTISCSYYDSSEHYDTALGGDGLGYCFDHVSANSVKVTSGTDANVQGRTPDSFDIPIQLNNEGWILAEDGRAYLGTKSKNDISVKKVDDFPTHVQNYGMYGRREYNEVAISRYDEAGNPIKPDLIKLDSRTVGDIRDIQKKHAAFFDVPIVLVDNSKYEYPIHKEELKARVVGLEAQIEDSRLDVDVVVEKEIEAFREGFGILSLKSFDKWSEKERTRNPELYLLMQKKRMIEVSPRSEDDRKNRINEYKNELQVIIQNDLNIRKRYLESKNFDGAGIENELKDYEGFCRELAITPRSEWTKEQVKECKNECLDYEQFMDIARDLELLKKAMPLKEEDRNARLREVLNNIKKQIDREVSEREQELRSLIETLPGDWSEEDKRFYKELYFGVLVLYAREKRYRELVERYDALSAN